MVSCRRKGVDDVASNDVANDTANPDGGKSGLRGQRMIA
jgi:hypothetical protein